MEVSMEPRNQIMKEATFWTSRVILTAAELDVFTLLDESPLTSSAFAHRTGSDPRATDRLLNSLVALDFLEKREDLFSLSAKGTFLSSRHPQTILPSILHHSALWQSWSQLTSVVREGKPAKRAGTEMDQVHRKAFIGAMDVAGRDLSIRMADAFDASRFKRFLDIGGASGTYTIAFLRKNPQMTAVLFDLPPVIPIARERMEAEELTNRVDLAAGDYNEDAILSGCDLALLSAIIHQNSPEQNYSLFGKIFAALDPGGVLLIRDFIMDSSRTTPKKGALFALNMLVNTAAGDTYTFAEVSESLQKAGFINVELLRGEDQQDDLISAEKPR
jgi:SAM-dependent methyltransferase